MCWGVANPGGVSGHTCDLLQGLSSCQVFAALYMNMYVGESEKGVISSGLNVSMAPAFDSFLVPVLFHATQEQEQVSVLSVALTCVE